MKGYLRLAAIPVAGLLLAAGGQPPAQFTLRQSLTANPVEQQTQGGATQPDHNLWVVNNTGCIWDADDVRLWQFDNSIVGAGQSPSATVCEVADWQMHYAFVQITSPSNSLLVSLNYPDQSFTVTASAVSIARRTYRYTLCVGGPKYEIDYTGFQPIPNSGYGGVGVMPANVVATVSNPTSSSVKSTYAVFHVAGTAQEAGCSATPLNYVGLNPRFALP